MTRTFVIAEAAACHDGVLDKAFRLVELAKSIDADAVKFQWTSSPERMAARRHAPEYLPAYHGLAFPLEWLGRLAGHAAAIDLEFMCTVYLPEDIPVIAPHVSRFKVASFEASDVHFVNAHRRYAKDILVSCGLAAVPPFDVIRLHCVSAYPCPKDQANLAAIRMSGGLLHGYSDHTQHPGAGALAVAAGARFVEFHVRLNDTHENNPDYVVARGPSEAEEYVQYIREAEVLLGNGVRCLMPAEAAMAKYRVEP